VSRQILQIVPAAAGWRHVYAFLGYTGSNFKEATDAELYGESPIACFALIQRPDDEEPYVRAIVAEDWPSYLWEVEEKEGHIGFLGPGERPDHHYRAEAISQIKAYRKAKAES
jgi:hypothetical protein